MSVNRTIDNRSGVLAKGESISNLSTSSFEGYPLSDAHNVTVVEKRETRGSSTSNLTGKKVSMVGD